MTDIEASYRAEDYPKAREGLAALAADSDLAMVFYRYARILLDPRAGPVDQAEAAVWLQKAVNDDYLPAMTLLARLYLTHSDADNAHQTAVALLSRAAIRGERDAQYYLGLLYNAGTGVAPDPTQAVNWLTAAAEKQHVDAAFELAKIYALGAQASENSASIIKWLRFAAQENHIEAQATLARALDAGDGIPQDRNEAFDWYRRAAMAGHPKAQRVIGTRYLMGDGAFKDVPEGLKWLTAAADAGDAIAMFNLGITYAQGSETEQDYDLAARYFEQAAGLQNPQAMMQMAALYENGFGREQDNGAAAQWYLKAYAADASGADIALGRMTVSGALADRAAPQIATLWVAALARTGDTAALNWLSDHAQNGVRQAKYALGQIRLDSGDTGTETITLITDAAWAGDVAAQFRLGDLHSTGTGVSLDYIAAHQWLNIAAAQGHQQAGENRDFITALMTPEQIALAQTATRQFFETEAARAPSGQDASTHLIDQSGRVSND
jgi:TPR repeat protein